MIVFDVPEWLSWLFMSGVTFFIWASATLITMMIGGIVNGAISKWRSK